MLEVEAATSMRPTRMVYEAGPTGYGLARRALAEGIELGVCAPSKTERPAERVKSAARSTGTAPGETRSRKHRSWLTSIRFADPASQATLADYLQAHDVLIPRRDQVENDLAKLAVCAPFAHAVARLRCLRGIDTLSALGLCAEIGEWERFDHPDQLSAYLGIVPSEHTTGQQRRLGSSNKAGCTHARRLLVEASYHYRRGPVVGQALERRQRGHAPVILISCKAQRRLHARWRQLKDARRKPGGSSLSRSPRPRLTIWGRALEWRVEPSFRRGSRRPRSAGASRMALRCGARSW